MKIVIAGGSGFIGQKLTRTYFSEGHEIVILSRNRRQNGKNIKYVKWLQNDTFPKMKLEHADAIINLAGVSINEGRWTEEHQKQIYGSRMTATDELLRIIKALPKNLQSSLMQVQSAFILRRNRGIHGKSKEVAEDFLGKTVHDWEKKASH